MKCAEVRHRILSADIAALRGESDPELAGHLAECASCAAARSAIVEGTDVLNAALRSRRASVPPSSRGRSRSSGYAALSLAAAASIALVAYLANRAPTGLEPAPVLNTPPVATTPRVPEKATPGVAASAVTRRVRPLAVASAIDSAALDPSLSQVRVTVGTHQRAAVLATSNPKITVIWLY